MKRRITLDFETRSCSNLKQEGAYKYSLDPSTRVTCLAFKEHGKDAIPLFNFHQMGQKFSDFPLSYQLKWKSYIDDGYLFVAHNAFFETSIYKNILVKRFGWPDIPFRQFRCTAAKAAACALPRNLEGAGEALALTIQKDKMGYVAMMATCKPTRQWNAWRKAREEVAAGKNVRATKLKLSESPEPLKFISPESHPNVFATLYRYCKIDVKTEELLDDRLPDLIPHEQEIWFLNQKLNWRGLRVDIPTAKKIVAIMAVESKKQLEELDDLTLGIITKAGARDSIMEFLKLDGVELPDLKAKTVEDVLQSGELTEEGRKLLEIRKALSKSSTKKFQGMVDRAMPDDWKVRDILLYHGGSTGRDSGTGLQPHNFPKPVIPIDKDNPYAAIKRIAEHDADTLKMLYGDNLSLLFSSVLRNMIIPDEGYELFVADFSKIEVAVLWWLADNWPGLHVLKSGKDPYIYQAAANLGVSYDKVPVDGDERQLGKAQVLGAGFRMGWKKFKTTAWDLYRVQLTNKESVQAIKSYRETNAPVAELWDAYEEAVIKAVKNKGRKLRAGKCVFQVADDFLWVTLPSGRKLAYFRPDLVWKIIEFTVLEERDGKEVEVTKKSRPKETLSFYGVDRSKKGLQVEFHHGGIMAENITQAVARDIMMASLLRLEKAKYKVKLAVHDEGICQRKKGLGTIEEFQGIMCERLAWADENLPIDAKGYKGERYRK